MILGENTAIRALKSVEGIDRLGPAYLIARESAAERENTLMMGLMLVFIGLLFGYISWFWEGEEGRSNLKEAATVWNCTWFCTIACGEERCKLTTASWLKLRLLHPLTLKSASQKMAWDEVKELLTKLEPFAHKLLEL
jgi:hypothetical protein